MATATDFVYVVHKDEESEIYVFDTENAAQALIDAQGWVAWISEEPILEASFAEESDVEA